MNPAFSLTNLIENSPSTRQDLPMIEIMKKKVDESSRDSAIIDCDGWVNKALLDIICMTAFGYDADSVTTRPTNGKGLPPGYRNAERP